MLNSGISVENYITHDSVEKWPPIRKLWQADHNKTVLVLTHSHEELRMSVSLDSQKTNPYFAINIKYIVSVHNMSLSFSAALYCS